MRWLVLMLSVVGGIAPAAVGQRAPPDGYSCDETAFVALRSFKGEVRIGTDNAYRPTDAQFTYKVSDHVTGRSRMSATWTLDGKAIAGGERVFIPLWREPSTLPLTVALKLDDVAIGTRRYERRDGKVAVLDEGGRLLFEDTQVAVTSDRRDKWIPELLGHSVLSYRISDANGAVIGGDELILPERRKIESVIGPALRRVEGRRKRKACNPFYRLTGV